MSDLITHLTDENFEAEVLQAKEPVLVDFWAEWCGPCKMIAPILDSVAQDYQGRLKIAKLNVDNSDDMPAKFSVKGIPTLLLFRDGEVVATKVGALTKAQLVSLLDEHI